MSYSIANCILTTSEEAQQLHNLLKRLEDVLKEGVPQQDDLGDGYANTYYAGFCDGYLEGYNRLLERIEDILYSFVVEREIDKGNMNNGNL